MATRNEDIAIARIDKKLEFVSALKALCDE